jgi:hypothetical protein
MRQKKDRIPLTFKNSSEIKIKSEKSLKSINSKKKVLEFNYSSNERIFGGDYSDQLSHANVTKKSISISELSGLPMDSKSPPIHPSKHLSQPNQKLKEIIIKSKKENYNLESQSRFGTSSIFGETFSNGGWELQTAIICEKHKGEEVMYWEAEKKELLCGQCLLDDSSAQMKKKANLKNIHKSLPHIRQTIEDSVNEVSLQCQFLKNKKKELEICQGSLQTQRKSWENKFKIEIKEFFSHCVDVKDDKVNNLKSHFKNINEGIQEGLEQMKEKEDFLENVTSTFEKLVSSQASTEKTINFYCQNIKEIDLELENTRELNEKVESYGGKSLFHYSNENGQIWFLKYLLGFYEQLSEYVFSRKTFFKEKLNSFEQGMQSNNIINNQMMSVLNNQSSNQNIVLNSNHKTRVNPPVGSHMYRESNFHEQNEQSFNINFPSQLNNENPSTIMQSKKHMYQNYNSSGLPKPKAISNLENLSEMKEEVSKHKIEPHEFQNDSGKVYMDSGYKKVPSHFQSRKSNRKSNLFSHKKQNFTNPVADLNNQNYEQMDRVYKASDKKRRKRNFTTTPKNCFNRIVNKNFQRKPQAQEIEVMGQDGTTNKSDISKNESKEDNT